MDSAVGICRNGACIAGGNLGGRTFTRIDLFDIDRVEVLRGSQGAVYGRNAVGGTINVISVKPRNVFEGEAELTYDQNDKIEGLAVVNAPATESLFFRAGLNISNQSDGFYRKDKLMKYSELGWRSNT